MFTFPSKAFAFEGFRLLPRSGERALREMQGAFHLLRRDERSRLRKKLLIHLFCGMIKTNRELREKP